MRRVKLSTFFLLSVSLCFSALTRSQEGPKGYIPFNEANPDLTPAEKEHLRKYRVFLAPYKVFYSPDVAQIDMANTRRGEWRSDN